MTDALIEAERNKYEGVWEVDGYRRVSPGELCVYEFLSRLSGKQKVVDIGCGSGRAAKIISKFHYVVGFDIAKNCLDKDIDIDFVVGCAWESVPKGDWAFCTDVMEHIPEERVEQTILSISNACRNAFFRIFLHKDNGKFSDEPLHLTVKSAEWWKERLKYWDNVNMESNGTVATYWCKR